MDRECRQKHGLVQLKVPQSLLMEQQLLHVTVELVWIAIRVQSVGRKVIGNDRVRCGFLFPTTLNLPEPISGEYRLLLIIQKHILNLLLMVSRAKLLLIVVVNVLLFLNEWLKTLFYSILILNCMLLMVVKFQY